MSRERSRFLNFLTNQDAYGQPLALSYKKSQAFQTACGGILTIMHGAVIICFVAFIGIELSSPQWAISDWVYTGVEDDGYTPNYELQKHMIPSLALNTLDNETCSSQDIDQLFTVYFAQYYSNGTYYNHLGVPCSSQLDRSLFSIEENQYCPNYTAWSNMSLQSSQSGDNTYFMIWVAECEDVQDQFGTTDCKPKEKSSQCVKNMDYKIITYSELASGNFEIGEVSDRAYSDRWVQTQITKASDYQQIQVTVRPLITTYAINWFLASLQQIQRVYFTIQENAKSEINSVDKMIDFYNGAFFNVQFILTLERANSVWTRSDVMSEIARIGGVMSLIVLCVSKAYQPWAAQISTLALSQDLYTMNTKKSLSDIAKANAAKASGSVSQGPSAPNQPQAGANLQTMKTHLLQNQANAKHSVVAGMKMRIPFDYPTLFVVCDAFKNTFCCCFQCFVCARRSESGKRYDKALDYLYGETDLVDLIKMQRLNKFLHKHILRSHHYHLLRWFDEHHIKSDSSEVSDQFIDENENEKDNSDQDPASKFKLTSEAEKAIKRQIRLAKSNQDNYSGDTQRLYQLWLQDATTMVKWLSIYEHFDPTSNETDYLALSSILGSKYPFTSKDVPKLTSAYKNMIAINIKNKQKQMQENSFQKIVEELMKGKEDEEFFEVLIESNQTNTIDQEGPRATITTRRTTIPKKRVTIN